MHSMKHNGMSLGAHIYAFLLSILFRVVLLGPGINNGQRAFHNIWNSSSHQQCMGVLFTLYLHQHLLILAKMVLHCGFQLHYWWESSWASFHVYWPMDIFLSEVTVKVFLIFLLISKPFPLLGIGEIIYSYSVAYIFTLLMASFDEQ